ncbi:endonuclease/exonuclease/phosphatase family protein [Aquabacterium humicola]|uniref:endonuclease/exonuclease/phosphatase family protein n=1 Tax=Aquabacterium humicola TaxID=3237377 RepID=UPI0025426DDF|nr:endonuclease/exonuclease/phosphatase family protein [Rubrivivax pictus]
MISLQNGSTYSQNFDTLAASGTSSAMPDGWFFSESGTNADGTYNTGNGSNNAGNTYSFGATGSSERALGGLLSGSLTPLFGGQISNDTGATLLSVAISYFGEQWRFGATGRADKLDFQYSLDATSLTTGTWVNVDALDYGAAQQAAAGPVDGNANRTAVSGSIEGLNLASGATLWIRWTDANVSGADDGLAIDDLQITPTTGGGGAPVVNLSVSSATASEADGTVITVTATATQAVSGAQTVTLGVGGNGITAGDYLLSSTTITIPDGQTSGSVSFTVQDDGVPEGNETAVLTISDPSAGITLGGTVSQNVVITNNDAGQPPLKISAIQGAAHLSPLLDSATDTAPVQNVRGIVTAIGSNGFYMQDPEPDADIATSEAIFVFTGANSPNLTARTVGEAVQVAGTLSEFRPGGASSNNLTVTQISNNANVQALSITAWAGAPAGGIAPTVLGVDRVMPTQVIHDDFAAPAHVESGGDFDPATEGIDFFESLEGMLVQINGAVTSSPTINFNNNSQEIWVLADGGAGATSTTAHGGALINANDFNPERLQIDDLINSTSMPTVDVGAILGTTVGVVNYDFGNYEVLVPVAPSVEQASQLEREVTTLGPQADQLRLANFNVENLDPSDGASKFNALAAAIVANLKSPDIITLEEVQDNSGATNNGIVDANVTLQMLIDAIAAAGGPTYQFRQLNPVNGQDGGEPGGNIRVAFLFNPSRVGFVEDSLERITDTDLSNGDAFAASRKPLVGTFTFHGEAVTVVGNHFNSKGGDQALFGATQPPVLGSEVQRQQQAEIVGDYVEALLAENPHANVIVAGDLNDFEFSNPVERLKDAGLDALIETLPANERYSYNFEGNAQTLDHVMASDRLMGHLAGFDVVHINSEFFDQMSDHDPSVAAFTIALGQTINGTNLRDNLKGTAANDTIRGGAGRDLIATGGGADTLVYTSLLDAGDIVSDFQPGIDHLNIAALLASIKYAGSDPVADGVLAVVAATGKSLVTIDVDGSAGPGAARVLVELTGVAAFDADLLLAPGT